MRTNPFTYGKPILVPTRFFGREHEVNQIFHRLRYFEATALEGERRIGKTSLLNYIASPEVLYSHGIDLHRHLVIRMDLQMVDKDMTPVQFWQRFLREVAKHCPDADAKQICEKLSSDPVDNFLLQDLFDMVDKKDLHVILLLSELEHLVDNQNFADSFFYSLRSLAIHHNLSLVTSSRSALIELFHSSDIRSSPFFNIFGNITIGPFTEAEARDFISLSLTENDISFTDTEVDSIFRMAGYHPYFLQIACSFLFEAYLRGLEADARNKFLRRAFQEEARPQLDDYWHNSDDREKMVLTTLALLERRGKTGEYAFSLRQLQIFYKHSDTILARLESRSLLKLEDDMYALFNTSFSKWIYHEVTDTMHDQQNYEDWLKSNRGLMERFSTKAKREMGELLPKVSSKYRELLITWISDPKNWITIVELLKKGITEIHP